MLPCILVFFYRNGRTYSFVLWTVIMCMCTVRVVCNNQFFPPMVVFFWGIAWIGNS